MRSSTKIAFLAAGCLLALGTRTAAGQVVPVPPAADTTAKAPAVLPRPAGPIERTVALDLLTGAIEPGAARSAGTGERMWGAQIGMGVAAYRVLSLNLDLGIVGMSDEAQFSQETNQGSKSSGVAAGLATLTLGVRTPPLKLGKGDTDISVGVGAGSTWLNVNRDITNCPTCHSEDVKLHAGTFWEPGVHVTRGRPGISARYRMYRDDSDVRDALTIGLTGAF